jgi:hypothetical protein
MGHVRMGPTMAARKEKLIFSSLDSDWGEWGRVRLDSNSLLSRFEEGARLADHG